MTEISLEQKRRILETRLSLVESHLSFLQENINEAPAAELNPDLAVLNQSPAAKDYWDKIGQPKDPGILKKISNFFRKGATGARRAAGVVNPEVDTSDPQNVKSLMDKSLSTSRSQAAAFKNKALNTTKDIDVFHNTVVDALDKFQSLATTLPMNLRGKYEREVIGMAKNFFILLNNEKGRIESYLQTLNSDLKKNGYNPAVLQSESKEPDVNPDDECEDIDKESLHEGVSPERWQELAGMKIIKEYGGRSTWASDGGYPEKKDRYGGDPSDEEKAEQAAMAAEIAADIEDEKNWAPDPEEEDRRADRRGDEQRDRAAEYESSYMKENDDDEGIRMSRTYGDIPNQKELETIMKDNFYMTLKGSDRLAFDYALISQNLQSLEKGEYDAEDLHAVLSALLNTPDETLLNFHELEGVNELLGKWDEATDSEDIVDRTHNIASSILSNLGVEWI